MSSEGFLDQRGKVGDSDLHGWKSRQRPERVEDVSGRVGNEYVGGSSELWWEEGFGSQQNRF